MKQTTLTKQRPAHINWASGWWRGHKCNQGTKNKCKGISSAGALKSSGPQMAVFWK